MNYLLLDKDIFYSIVNMKLRDTYKDMKDLCISENIEIEDFKQKLESLNLKYDKENNRLIDF